MILITWYYRIKMRLIYTLLLSLGALHDDDFTMCTFMHDIRRDTMDRSFAYHGDYNWMLLWVVVDEKI